MTIAPLDPLPEEFVVIRARQMERSMRFDLLTCGRREVIDVIKADVVRVYHRPVGSTSAADVRCIFYPYDAEVSVVASGDGF